MLKKSIHTMIITMISRVLGLFRGTLVAYFFGASVLTDAYYSAFKISNFFRQLLGEGALGNTFIPLCHKKKKEEGEERTTTITESSPPPILKPTVITEEDEE